MRRDLRLQGPVLRLCALMAISAAVFMPVNTYAQEQEIVPYSARDLSNPSRGQYENLLAPLFPQSNEKQSTYPAWPKTFDASARLEWKQLQPTKDTYDFSTIDRLLKKNTKEGKRTGIRVTAFNSCCETSYTHNTNSLVPDWLRSVDGATTDYKKDGITHVIPNWDNDAYLTAFTKLITALGARYNKDERLSIYEFSGYGDFSENHNAFMRDNLQRPSVIPERSIASLGYYSRYQDQYITKASIKKLVDTTLEAFPDTQIIAAPGNPEIIKQLMRDSGALPGVTKPVGIRADCLGVYAPIPTWAENQYSYYVTQNDSIIQTIRDRWKSAPIVTEWCNFGADDKVAYYTKGLRDVMDQHISMLASTGMPDQFVDSAMTEQTYDLWRRANVYSGYRYAAGNVTKLEQANPDTTTLQIDWTNYGSAPTYDDWTVAYKLLDEHNAVVQTIPSSLKLSELFAEQSSVSSVNTTPAVKTIQDQITFPSNTLVSGNYTLATVVEWNEHKNQGVHRMEYPAMQLALTNQLSDGVYPLGTISITGVNAEESTIDIPLLTTAFFVVFAAVLGGVVYWQRDSLRNNFSRR